MQESDSVEVNSGALVATFVKPKTGVYSVTCKVYDLDGGQTVHKAVDLTVVNSGKLKVTDVMSRRDDDGEVKVIRQKSFIILKWSFS